MRIGSCKVLTLKVNRIYPVKMILRLSRSPSEEQQVFTYDLHLNRKGLVRHRALIKDHSCGRVLTK